MAPRAQVEGAREGLVSESVQDLGFGYASLRSFLLVGAIVATRTKDRRYTVSRHLLVWCGPFSSSG